MSIYQEQIINKIALLSICLLALTNLGCTRSPRPKTEQSVQVNTAYEEARTYEPACELERQVDDLVAPILQEYYQGIKLRSLDTCLDLPLVGMGYNVQYLIEAKDGEDLATLFTKSGFKIESDPEFKSSSNTSVFSATHSLNNSDATFTVIADIGNQMIWINIYE